VFEEETPEKRGPLRRGNKDAFVGDPPGNTYIARCDGRRKGVKKK